MLTSGKNIRALRDKNINILILVLSAKKFLNETKNHTPPLQVKWSVPYNKRTKYTVINSNIYYNMVTEEAI